MTPRRFPPPWTVKESAECFIVHDKNGQALGHFFFEEAPGRRAAANLLIKDEARRMAAKFAKLPQLLRRNELIALFLSRGSFPSERNSHFIGSAARIPNSAASDFAKSISGKRAQSDSGSGPDR